MGQLARIPPGLWDLLAALVGVGLIGAGLWQLFGWGAGVLGVGVILCGGACWSTRRGA